MTDLCPHTFNPAGMLCLNRQCHVCAPQRALGLRRLADVAWNDGDKGTAEALHRRAESLEKQTPGEMPGASAIDENQPGGARGATTADAA